MPLPKSNKEIAEALIAGRTKTYAASDLKKATAVRVAGHRLGFVLTVKAKARGWVIVNAGAKVSHRPKPKPAAGRGKKRAKAAR
jgi:hypothetical protein